MSRQILSMFLPVLMLCALILAYSVAIVKHSDNSMQAWKILVYKQKHEVSTTRSAQHRRSCFQKPLPLRTPNSLADRDRCCCCSLYVVILSLYNRTRPYASLLVV